MGEIKLGDMARDTVTGFNGLVFSIAKNLYGCDSILIKPTTLNTENGQPIESIWFDVLQVETIEKRVSEVTPPGEGVG